MIVHFGETLPAGTVDPFYLSAGTLMLWAIAVFCLIPFSFGVGAPSGMHTLSVLLSDCVMHWWCQWRTMAIQVHMLICVRLPSYQQS